MEKLGTTLMILPEADALAIHNHIPGAQSVGQGGFTVPCNTSAVVALTYAGQSFTIDTRDLAWYPVNSSDPNGDCASGIAAGNFSEFNEWLVSVLPCFFFGFCESLSFFLFLFEKNKSFRLAIRS